MNIQQFEKQISKVILKRGKDYYENGSISELEQVAANAWRAKILGTNAYFVYVQLADEHITVSQCDCPFDGTCKHEVAVYFAIRKALNKKPATDYKAYFQHYEKQELVDILADLVAQDPALQKRFAPIKTKEKVNAELLIAQAKSKLLKLIGRYLRTYTDDAFQDVMAFIETVIDDAQAGFAKEPLVVLELMTLCVEQLAGVQDDAPTWMYEQIEQDIFGHFSHVLGEVKTNDEAITVSNWLLKRFEKNAKGNLVHVFLVDGAIQISSISNAKYHIIDALGRYSRYTNQQELAQSLHFSLLMEVGTPEEITAFIHQEQPPVKLRNLLIDYCVREKRYEEALQLCADGIDTDAPSHYRTRWLRQAYQVHKETNNIAAQRTIAFELALDCEMDDIERLKALYQKEPALWQEVSQDLVMMIEQTKSDSYYYTHVLELLEEWQRLLQYCQQHPQAILRYCQSLRPHYPQEVEHLLTQLLLEKSQRASNRSHYQELANIIERLLVLDYEQKANELIAYLRTTYPRKTALHEILNQI
ncbi:MAG: hypothetical protein ABS942_13395 [Solibacillus sp.]